MNTYNRSTVLFKQYSYFYTEISFQAADVVIFWGHATRVIRGQRV